MTHAVVLGAGMVGTAMAVDLAAQDGWQVTVADVRPDALAVLAERHGVATRCVDLSQPAGVAAGVEGADIVLGALASRIGLQTLRSVIETGHNYCDISFMADDATSLAGLAEARGVTAVVDCGVAPGMSNMLAGYANHVLQPCETLAIYVGGLPVVRELPYEYKAGFAPADALEEYVRPARVVEHAKEVVYPALDGVEQLHFDGVGTLEAFLTDGLRSLVHTLPIPHMVEKTMRYPGHVALMKTFRELGLFSEDPIELSGGSVIPLELTSKLLFPKWTFGPGEADVTVMRVIASGLRKGKRVRHTWDLLDRYDPETDMRSMSRTTAFPATIVAKAIVDGRFRRPGVHPPETLGAVDGLLDYVLDELGRRGVRYEATVEVLD